MKTKKSNQPSNIPFSTPYLAGNEQKYLNEALQSGKLSAGGIFTLRCEALLEQYTVTSKVLLTNSCTAALELTSILIDIHPGDEVIMPSYTYPSTANAFVLMGATPVFVDIRPDTPNIDETLIEAAITLKTKAIVVVHYAGVACEMDTIMMIARKHHLIVIEDAAQAFMASYRGRPLGSIGHFGTFSFHSTKNINCGEGGALLINDKKYQERAEAIRNKGTNRKQFLEGRLKAYSWTDIGNSSAINELSAAYLLAQLEKAEEITKKRYEIWKEYHQQLASLAEHSVLQILNPSPYTQHNSHIFPIILNSQAQRDQLKERLEKNNVEAHSHYEPLHSAKAGRQYSKPNQPALPNTEKTAAGLLRLPLGPGMSKDQARLIANLVLQGLNNDL